MNILRDIRRLRSKKLKVKLKIRLILVFLIMLMLSIYAWLHIAENKITNFRAETEPWDVEYIYDEEVVEKELSIKVDEFYPGIEPVIREIEVHNLGKLQTQISIEITKVILFGRELDVEELMENEDIRYINDNIQLFNNQTYPFNINCTLDKTILGASLTREVQGPEAIGILTFYSDWEFESSNDDLDTQFGKTAYEYYEELNSGMDNSEDNQFKSALEIGLKITSRKYPE